MKNYYSILGISTTATSKEIKARFRILAMQWHPDKNKAPEAHKMFIEINEAYQILIDEAKRKVYDELLRRPLQETKETETFERDGKFEQYKKWTEREQRNAEEFAKMSFKDYAKLVFNFIDGVHTGIAHIIGFVFGFGFFLDGILLIVLSFLYCLGKTDFFIFSSFYSLLWILPLSFVLLFFGDIMFYEPLCKLLNIKNRWPRFKSSKK